MAGQSIEVSEGFGERLRAAFDELLAVDAADRAGFIRESYPDDEPLRRELLQMIQHLDDESAFLEPPEAKEVRHLLGASTEDPAASRSALAEPLPDLEGVRFAGRYELGTRLGAGGQSVVHEAMDVLQDRPVAVKVLRDTGERSRQALRREAAALRLLRLPGVVQLFDEGVEDGLAFLVTERVDGRPFPGRQGPVAWEDLRGPATALLEALERMHRAGIVHGDLKPGNVLVRPDGVPVILDLGIAEGPRSAVTSGRIGVAKGTLRYVAPEQAEQASVTPRSDVYAAGVMLHEALAGTPYRSDPSVALVRIGVVGESRKPLAELAPETPAHVQEAVERMLAYAPEDRPASATEALSRLDPDASRRRRALPFLEAVSAPCSARELRAAFAGTDRLMHIPGDAARELFRRTRGDPGAVVDELDAWSRAGLGWWDGDRYHIRRSDIEQLQRGVHALAAGIASGGADVDLADVAIDVLLAAELAGPRAMPSLLAAVLDLSEADIDRVLALLEEMDLLRLGDGSRVVVRALPAAARAKLAEHGDDLHRRLALALPPGDERRLLHWAAAGQLDVVPAESIAVVERLLHEGDVGGARVAVDEGLSALALRPDPPWTTKLLELSLQVALQRGTRQALDEYLHVLQRHAASPRLQRLEGIAQGTLHAMDGQPARALEEIPGPEDAPSDADRRCAVSARLFAARFLGEETLDAEIERAEHVAVTAVSRPIRATVASTRGWLHYARERYEEAAQHHLEAVEDTPSAASRASACLNAASALLEVGDFDRAELLAGEALAFARERRHALSEARAERVCRAAAYRRGDALEPDPELVDACEELGNPNIAGLVALNEAAVAWRAGESDVAGRLAARAVYIWRGELDRWPRLVARSLVAVASGLLEEDEAESLLGECEACPSPAAAVQAAGLLLRVPGPLAARFRELATTRLHEVPTDRRHIRLEVLAPSEAIA